MVGKFRLGTCFLSVEPEAREGGIAGDSGAGGAHSIRQQPQPHPHRAVTPSSGAGSGLLSGWGSAQATLLPLPSPSRGQRLGNPQVLASALHRETLLLLTLPAPCPANVVLSTIVIKQLIHTIILLMPASPVMLAKGRRQISALATPSDERNSWQTLPVGQSVGEGVIACDTYLPACRAFHTTVCEHSDTARLPLSLFLIASPIIPSARLMPSLARGYFPGSV